MIANPDRLLRALGALESRGRAYAHADEMHYAEYPGYHFGGGSIADVVTQPRTRLSLSVDLVGDTRDLQAVSPGGILIAAARDLLEHGHTLTDDELAERMCAWWGDRVHRPNKR